MAIAAAIDPGSTKGKRRDAGQKRGWERSGGVADLHPLMLGLKTSLSSCTGPILRNENNLLNATLFEAIAAGDGQKVASLLDEGADPNAVDDRYGATALRDAVDGADDEAEHSDIVRVLLECGEDPNKDKVLLSATHHKYTETVRLLLAYGVDPNQRCKEGSALDDAEQLGYTEIADMLRAAGAHH